MEIGIYAKKRQTRDGRTFYIYLTKLTKKDGEEINARVKFNEAAPGPKPEACPCNIIVDKANCNFNHKRVLDKSTGEVYEQNTLWVNQWAAGSEWVDTSMDEFED